MKECDEQNLHLIGSIQGGSNAYVLVVSSDLRDILAASTNSPTGTTVETFQPQFSRTVQKMATGQVRSFFRSSDSDDVSVCICPPDKYILEVEPACSDRPPGEVWNLGSIVENISVEGDAHSVTTNACDVMFEIFGMYDRGMVYRFNDDLTGEVVHEIKGESVPSSYLNLRFPASDIPIVARELYLRNSMRFIEVSPDHVFVARKWCFESSLSRSVSANEHIRPLSTLTASFLELLRCRCSVKRSTAGRTSRDGIAT